ncbi:MAG: hypothetical protein JO069_19375 [Verrucomicrobia bacterium]|nr:hypothetical protein [Verrucomicrobiota bacterium]
MHAARIEPPAFESPGKVDAHRFLPSAVFQSTRHRVSPEAFNDGLLNTYSVRNGRETFSVTGTTAFLERWQELRGIDQLRRVTGTQAFERALKQSAKETGASAEHLFTDPLASLRRAPEGAERFFGRIGDALRGDEGDESRDGTLAGALGLSDAKRKLAAQLGVDVYSANETLQAELERVARAQALGGLALDVGSFFVTGAASVALTAVGISQTVEDLVRTSTPEELRRRNRQQLLALGATEDVATAFFEHAWYTPRDETVIVSALRTVGVNPEAFLVAACQARTRGDALFFRNSALLAADYRQRKTAVSGFRVVNGVLCLLGEGGTLVVPVSFDYLQWTEPVARVADAFAGPSRQSQGIETVVLWPDGQLSPRAPAELGQRSIVVESSAKLAGP